MLSGGPILTTAYEGTSIVATGATKHWVAGDTLYYINTSGYVYRRIGLAGSNTQLWPASGSSGSAEHFLFSNGYMVVRTTSGYLYSKTPSGSSWVGQAYVGTGGGENFALEGNRLVYSQVQGGGGKNVYSRYIPTSGSTTQVLEWTGSSSLPDVKVRHGMVVLIDNGSVWGNQYGSWQLIHDATNGPAMRLYVSDELTVFYYHPAGYSNDGIAVQIGGIYGGVAYYSGVPVSNSNDVDVCGDKVAFLQSSTYLRVINFTSWMVYEHYTLSGHGAISKVRLSGGNCDYVSIIDPYGYLWTKYGEDLNTDYHNYSAGAVALPMKF
jgi:hypothetical protein